MARVSIAGQVPGLLTDQVGVVYPVHTVTGSPLAPVQIDAWLTETAATPTVVRIGDGTSDYSLTVPAGQRSVSQGVSGLLWPVGATVEIEVTSAPGYEASALGLNILVAETQPTTGASDGLVTLDDLKTALGVTGATAEQDAYLSRQIQVCSDLIRLYCRRRFTRTTYRDTWYRPTSVWAADYPVESIVSVTRDGDSLVEGTDFLQVPRTGRLWRLYSGERCDWTDTKDLVVQYVAGTDPVPSAVAECLYVGIRQRWKSFTSSKGLEPAATTAGITYPDAGSVRFALPAGIGMDDVAHDLTGFPLSLLDPYREIARVSAELSEIL